MLQDAALKSCCQGKYNSTNVCSAESDAKPCSSAGRSSRDPFLSPFCLTLSPLLLNGQQRCAMHPVGHSAVSGASACTCSHAHGASCAGGREYVCWMRCAWAVEIASGLHCTAEGVLSVYFAARDGQISLLLFGLDSVIEVGCVCLVMWRLSGARAAVSKERLACGGIGALLILLFCAAVAASTVHLVQRARPESSVPGIIISSVSLFDMLLLSAAKFFLARRLASHCLASDAKCSLLCALLSLCLLAGSVAFKVQPSAWWVDAAAALALSLVILKEGVDILRNALSSNFVVGGCC